MPDYGITIKSNRLQNDSNLSYATSTWIGTPPQFFYSSNYDTGSGGYMVRTEHCTPGVEDCDGVKFETYDSSTFAFLEPRVKDTVTYGDGTNLEGDLATDHVCVTEDPASCI